MTAEVTATARSPSAKGAFSTTGFPTAELREMIGFGEAEGKIEGEDADL